MLQYRKDSAIDEESYFDDTHEDERLGGFVQASPSLCQAVCAGREQVLVMEGTGAAGAQKAQQKG